MEDDRREILTQVADGRLSPQEAAARLEELERVAAPRDGDRVKAVRIESTARSVVVTGDANVAEATAEGPHQAHREGDTLVIEDASDAAFGFRFEGSLGFALERQPLVVRMNPELALEADVQAGSLQTRGVKGPIRAEVQAGTVRLDGVAAPIKVQVQAGSVRVAGMLAGGDSDVRCEAGSVRVELDPESSVRVQARSGLGKVSLPNGAREWVAGSGAGTLKLDVGMGKVQVRER
jgi:hypothetical protein